MVDRQPLHIGLFGGTFDPVHTGHLILARHVLERCDLDRLLFLPSLRPPHKRQPEASFAHRAAMLEVALADWPDGRVALSLIEGDLPQPSYTINTVQALRAHHGDHRYALVLGADMLCDLPHWHRAAELMDLVSLIVVNRDRLDEALFRQTLTRLEPSLIPDHTGDRWVGQRGNTVVFLRDLHVPAASSAIRADLHAGCPPAMLPPAVLAYIQHHHLYGWQSA